MSFYHVRLWPPIQAKLRMEPLGNIDLLEVCHYYRGLGLSYCWSYRRKEPDNTGTYGLIGVALKMPISGRWGGGGGGGM